MGLFNRYATDAKTETAGFIYDLGDAKIRLARAGGANTAYLKRMEALTKPHRRAIEAKSLDREVMQDIVRQAFAETVVLGWETRLENGDFVSGIEDAEGNVQPFSAAQVIETLKALPDLFAEIQEVASDQSIFLKATLEADSKNSRKS